MISEEGEAIVDRTAQLLHRELGLRPDAAILSRLRRCLRDEVGVRQQDPEAYLQTLTADPAARQSLFNRITVQETSFFRHPGQFEALAHHVLPNLDGPVFIWSAACANGQEAYSLAMLLDEQHVQGTVFATDVSTKALKRTADARYLTRELSGLSAARRERYLEGGPDNWQIAESIRSRVTAGHLNLVTEAIPQQVARCQIVFCRNVLIYFSPEHATAFLTRLADRLPAGAYLFLGYAETIWQVTDLFDPVRIGDSFEFHRRRLTPKPPRPAQIQQLQTPMLTGRADLARRASRPRLARPPAKPVTTGRTSRPATPADQPMELARAGQAAVAGGDFKSAITAFRKCVYLAPDRPMGHVHLGLALEASGDRVSALRAFSAARSALDKCDASHVMEELGGYRIEELLALLDSREQGPCP